MDLCRCTRLNGRLFYMLYIRKRRRVVAGAGQRLSEEGVMVVIHEAWSRGRLKAVISRSQIPYLDD